VFTDRSPDAVAELIFLSTESGGRKTPCGTGYRATNNCGVAGMLNDAAYEFIGRDLVAPGETITARLWLLAPEYQKGRLHKDFVFTVHEGAKLVANGRITEVINSALLKSA
jgi:translation elongation factor EF-Tu-like GTPase